MNKASVSSFHRKLKVYLFGSNTLPGKNGKFSLDKVLKLTYQRKKGF